ncbi:FtsX-like permease family protein [Nocardioides sp.]|uniref:FtsX-like permease family protein n=1 Tax=Nocardioides sp. TaxID=35761 RepID=UPI003782ED6B
MRWRYRPFQAAVVATLAALVTACAVFAPLYDRAMQQSLVDLTLEQAPPVTDGLQLSAVYADAVGFGRSSTQPPPPPETVVTKVPAGVRSSFGTPVLGYAATATRLPGASHDPIGELRWRSDVCDHLTIVAGSCPDAAGEVAVSEADVDNFGLRPGASFRIAAVGAGDVHVHGRSTRLTVSGVYRQRPDDYWMGQILTGRSGLVSPTPPTQVQHDVWLTGRETFDSGLTLPGASSTVDLAVDPDAVGVDELLRLGSAVRTLADENRLTEQGATISVHSGLPALADQVRDQRAQSRVTVPLLMAQLGLLTVVVLWLVLLAVTEQRRPEVALARLRGRGRRGARGLLLGELLPVVWVGVVPGVLLAVVGSWVARTAVLPGDAPFELRVPVLGAVLLSVALLTVVTVLAVTRVAREPVATLLRRVPPRRAGWTLGVAEALLVAGCGSVVVVFATGGLDGPAALAAPGLLAVVVGVVLAHLTSPTAAVAGGRLLRRGRVRAGVSVLDAARSPATRRVVAVVTLATALAVFSADALLVGERNRASAAEQEAGAAMVASVRGTDLASVRAALAEVDAGGRLATPVLRVVPPSNSARETLAVVPGEFARIALFPGGAPPNAAWQRLATPDTSPVTVVGTRLAVDVDPSTLRSVGVGGDRQPVEVGLDLVTDAGEVLHATLGDLAPGADRARFTSDLSCRDGCYVTRITFTSLPGASIDGAATFSPLRTDAGQYPLGPADQWVDVADGDGEVRAAGRGDDLTVVVRGAGSQTVALPQAWLPDDLSALVAGDLPPGTDGNGFALAGVDGQDQPARRVASVVRVPASPPNTSVVNLDLAVRGRPVAANDQLEIWFAADDDALLDRVTAALRDRGVELGDVTRLTDVRRSYDESTAAWSLQLAALVGGAAVLIALLVLVVSAASSWAVRTRDLAALRMAGVGRGPVTTMSVAAQLPPVVVGVVAGTVAGVYGAYLALPIVPLFADAPLVSTLDLDIAWGPVLGAAAAALVVLGAGAVRVGRTMARRAGLRRLREGTA